MVNFSREVQMSVLVVGSIAFDTVETPHGRREEILGGSATHFSCAARYFTQVRVVAVVGSDFPSSGREFLESRGVDLEGLQVREGKTFRWEAAYHGDMAQAETLATHLNVFKDFSPEIPESYKDSPFVFLANIDPDLQADVLRQVEKPVLVAADTMNHWIVEKADSVRSLLSSVDAAILNDAEARMLTGEQNLTRAAQEIRSYGTKYVVVKKGEHGAVLFCGDARFALPGLLLVDVVDPTGAGDTFAGGFMGRLAQLGEVTEANLREAVFYGSAMASFNVQAFGVEGTANLTPEDINGRLEEFRSLVRI
jgi:sugar/nucleoside kinase (ribokinase family)